jgi:hypothetical protein
MRDAIRPYLAYLRRLWLRMEKRSFPKDDELFRAMSNAYGVTHLPWITLHYMSCASGHPYFGTRSREPDCRWGFQASQSVMIFEIAATVRVIIPSSTCARHSVPVSARASPN